MKKASILLISISFLFNSCAFKTDEKVDIRPFQKVLDSVYQENPDLLGIMVHIEAPNKNLSWSGAVGLSNKNDTVSIDPDQPVLLASTTKTYVSAAILRLVEQNKISLDSSVDTLISAKSRKALSDDGYDLSKIQIKHLLSHTSGIYDYTNSKTFNEKIEFQPDYRWTRDEQIKLAADEGDPVAEPEKVHKYCDTNYLLLTEIIEKLTGKVFYIAMRELLKYEELKLSSTWFYTLENTPVHLKPFITQYSGYCATDREDPSFDLFGGGGIATTTRDLALFTQYLFTGELFDHSETIDLIYTEVKTKEASQNSYKSYRMGVMEFEIKGMKAYGHRGFWGTYNIYIPQLNTSFAISISNEIDKFDLMRINLQEDLLEELESY
jgi:D-alanyl-D-alanine carboxypeptidase